MLSAKNSRVLQELLKIDAPDHLTERLFELIMGRVPEEDERTRCSDFLTSRADKRQQAVESLTWALLTSAEFRFNH